MLSKEKGKKFILLIGDGISFYIALFLMLTLRFGSRYQNIDVWNIHFKLFSLIFFIWLLVLYIGHLYEIRDISNRKKLIALILGLQLINFVIAIVFFYVFSVITPKTNLVITSALSTILILIWRLAFNQLSSSFESNRVLILGASSKSREVIDLMEKESGYKIVDVFEDPSQINGTLIDFVKSNNINTIAVSQLAKKESIHQELFKTLLSKIEILDLAEFYEEEIKKIPLSLADEQWFLFNLRRIDRKFYDSIKRILDFLLALLSLIITLPFWPIIALFIKIDSSGPVFFKSKRIGKNGKVFEIKKFRTMRSHSSGPHWTEKNDKRITKLGKFLRGSHLDEIPQFLNVLKGEMSFVGPRPEEEKLVELYREEIPFYNFRHLAQPGLVGWAQYNYPHGASVEDAKEKLKYDLYYLKNRSLWLDLGITIRTIRIFITQETH